MTATATKVSKKDRIEEELKEILAASPDGLLHAEDVVEYAHENKNSALNSKFPWDDEVAARLKRLDIARGIIRVYRIVVSEAKPESFRAYVSLSTDRTRGGGYRAAMDVLSSEEMRKTLAADFYKVMRNAMRKFDSLREFMPEVFTTIEQAIEKAKASA